MTANRAAREVHSDRDFVLADADCVACREPAIRHSHGITHHPVFASGELNGNNQFNDRKAATVCSGCISQAAINQCIREAHTRADNPEHIGHLFQVVGIPEQQKTILDLVHALDPEPAS